MRLSADRRSGSRLSPPAADAFLIHGGGSMENIVFAKLILKRPAYLGRDNQPDLSENKPQFSQLPLLLLCSSFLIPRPSTLHHHRSFTPTPSFLRVGGFGCPGVHVLDNSASLIEAAVVHQRGSADEATRGVGVEWEGKSSRFYGNI